MAVSPPFTIAETLPAVTDLVSQFPPVENTYRDVVESWLTQLSDPTTGLLKPTAFAVPFELESTDATATLAPIISLYRNSASPAASDSMGSLDFYGKDSAGNKQLYARIVSTIADPTSTTEDAELHLQLTVNSVLSDIFRLVGTGLIINSVSASTLTASGDIVTTAGNMIAAGIITSGQVYQSASASAILSTTGAGNVILRPNGYLSSSGQAYVDNTGVFRTSSNIYTLFGGVEANGGNFGSSSGVFYMRPNGIASAAGQAYIDGAGNFVAAGNVYAFSDRRLKDNVLPLQSVGDAIDAICPVSYTLRESGQDGIGFIAQDVQEFFPELVHESELGILGLSYSNLTAILWREVQDLRGRVKVLEIKPIQVTL